MGGFLRMVFNVIPRRFEAALSPMTAAITNASGWWAAADRDLRRSYWKTAMPEVRRTITAAAGGALDDRRGAWEAVQENHGTGCDDRSDASRDDGRAAATSGGGCLTP